ncbi:MAG: phosphoribosylanthranilate isomerase [Planctomycetes bacterium]|nr:phosphoribosylanthranilate isomerase [Planctomycetota bacterium]
MIRVKICGLTRVEDAEAAMEAGANVLGFVFWEKSPRACPPEVAREAARLARPCGVETVGVFVNEDPARVDSVVIGCGLDWAQLHGDEDEEYCRWLEVPFYRAFQARGPEVEEEIRRFNPRRFLLDTHRPGVPGGTGETFDWELARRVRELGELYLAGGLSPANVAAALSYVEPAGVDASSSLEASPGKKDHQKVRDFIAEVRRWERRTAGDISAGGSAGSSSPKR